MTELIGLRHSNSVVFKDAYLPLNKKGITQIRGNNKDSKLGGNLKDPNATGKSVLLRPITDIIFASAPLTKDIKTKARADLFTQKDSALTLSLEHEGERFDIIKKAKGKSYEYEVIQNDGNTNIRRKDYTEKKIRSMFGYTEDEFYTLWFIDSRKNSPLQFGTAAKRFEFFTNMFRLEDMDAMRRVFNSMLREAKNHIAKYDTLKKELKELGKLPSSKELAKLKATLSEQKKARKKVVEKIDSASKQLDTYLTLQACLTAYKKYTTVCDMLGIEYSKYTKVESKLRSILNDAKKYQEQNDAYSKFTTLNKEYEKQRKQLLNQVNGLDEKQVSKNLKEIDKDLSKVRNEYSELKIRVPEFNEKRFTKLKEKLPKKTADQLKDDIAQLRSYVNIDEVIMTKILGQLREHKHDKSCPVCKGPLTEISEKEIQKRIDASKSKIASLEKQLSMISDYEGLKKEYAEYKEAVKKEKTAKAAKAKLKKKFDKLTAKKKELKHQHSVFLSIANMRKPKPVDKPSVVMQSSKDLSLFTDVLNELPTVYPNIESFSSINIEEIPSKIKQAKKNLKNMNAQTVDDNYQALSNEVSTIEFKLKQAKRISKEMDELREYVDDVPIIETLIEAFSNKGMKLEMISFLAAKIEQNMNRFANLIFAEPIKFHFLVTGGNAFDIKAERKVNGTLVCTDVRTLSGAESRAFSFLLPLAILPLIPASRRLNVMVLDEPLQNVGEARRDLFINDFIPKLNSIIPHIIILSTEEENYKNSDVYYVVKENSVSSLKKLGSKK